MQKAVKYLSFLGLIALLVACYKPEDKLTVAFTFQDSNSKEPIANKEFILYQVASNGEETRTGVSVTENDGTAEFLVNEIVSNGRYYFRMVVPAIRDTTNNHFWYYSNTTIVAGSELLNPEPVNVVPCGAFTIDVDINDYAKFDTLYAAIGTKTKKFYAGIPRIKFDSILPHQFYEVQYSIYNNGQYSDTATAQGFASNQFYISGTTSGFSTLILDLDSLSF